MKFMPDLDEVKKISTEGEYKVLPVSTEILSDICTPIEAVGILKNVSDHCYMLESVAESERWGRYTFLGFEPKLEITCLDGEVKDGWYKTYTIAPEDFGLTRCEKSELVGGTPQENAAITRAILNGEKGAKRDAVLLNAGAALKVLEGLIEVSNSGEKQ